MATANQRKSRLFATAGGRSVASTSSVCVSIGSDLDIVLDDRKIKSDPNENKNRRTIVVKRENGSFGFTLQSYGLHHMNSNETDLLSYVDYVELGGPAYKAGMREGDVILSINGKSMENVDHQNLVDSIKCCEDSIRMVVLFEDVCRKIELHLRYFKLKQILETKRGELLSLSQHEAKILQKVGACSVDGIGVRESIDTSSVFGSIYLSCSDAKLGERYASSSSVFQSTSNLGQFFDSSGTTPLNLSSNALHSSTQNIKSPQVDVPRGMLPAYNDEFWSSNFGYGSLPIRSQKRGAKNSFAAKSTSSVRWQIGERPFVSTTLHEEADESNNFHQTSDNQVECNKLSVPYPATLTEEILSATNFVPQNLENKNSASVPNLHKLNVQSSPFVPRRLLSEQPNRKQKLMRNDKINFQISVVHDPRTMTKQLRQEISNYVMTEDLNRKSDDPQLLGLQQLCNDFRYGCIQESLKQRRKSIELKMTLDPNGSQLLQRKTGFQLSNPFWSFRNSRAKKPPTDLSRRLPEDECSEIENAAKMSESADFGGDEIDKRGVRHGCHSAQGKASGDQRRHLPSCVCAFGEGKKESRGVNVEVTDGCKTPTTQEKLTRKKVEPASENSAELSAARGYADQSVSVTDEVTHL